MNNEQILWWRQARSDLDVLDLLRINLVAPCHQLHYLQMITEKLAKAYFWGKGTPPRKDHAGFVQFMRALGSVPLVRRPHVTKALAFNSFDGLQCWIRSASPLIYDLERMAPALARDGPNPEYPWPHAAPANTPVLSEYAIWRQLSSTGRGRQLTRIIQLAVERFPTYA